VRFVVLKRALTWAKKSGDAKGTHSSIPRAIEWRVKVTAASASDLAGAKKMLEPLINLFPRMQLVWGDSHYRGTLVSWVKEQLGWDVEVVQSLGTVPDTSTEPSEPEEKESKARFKVLPRRWVVERSFAWITRWRRLCRDHEGLPESSEADHSNSRRVDACSRTSLL
jgi:DDE family transposase